MEKLAILLCTTLLMASFAFAANSTDTSLSLPDNATTQNALAPEEDDEAVFININDDLKIVPAFHREKNADAPYSIDVTYPQISGNTLTPEAIRFNQNMTQLMNQTVQQFKNYVKADMPHMKTLPDSLKHNTLSMDYDLDLIKPANKILVSVRFVIEGMQAGRAHPYHKHQVLNYDLTTGQVLALSDLFKPKARYLDALSNYAMKKLGTTVQDKWMIKTGAAPDAKNFAVWNLEDDGILLTFEEYQVAPYVDGPQEVHVPYSALKAILSPTSPIISCADDSGSCAAE